MSDGDLERPDSHIQTLDWSSALTHEERERRAGRDPWLSINLQAIKELCNTYRNHDFGCHLDAAMAAAEETISQIERIATESLEKQV